MPVSLCYLNCWDKSVCLWLYKFNTACYYPNREAYCWMLRSCFVCFWCTHTSRESVQFTQISGKASAQMLKCLKMLFVNKPQALKCWWCAPSGVNMHRLIFSYQCGFRIRRKLLWSALHKWDKTPSGTVITYFIIKQETWWKTQQSCV